MHQPKCVLARSIAFRSASGYTKKNPRSSRPRNHEPDSIQSHPPIGEGELIPINSCDHGNAKRPSGPITFGIGKPLITPIVPIRSNNRTIVGAVQAKSEVSR